MTARLVVMISGGGTNLQAILDACAEGRLDAEVVAVVSNKAEAHGLERARLVGVEAVHVPVDGRSRAIYDGVLSHVVGKAEPDLVVLAGWMRLLTNGFLKRFSVVNIHPALPGAFPGLDAIERSFAAWEAGELAESGAMVHWVPDEGVDDGPVIAERVVPFEPGDSLASFEARLHAAEHSLYVEALASIIPELQSAGTP
jgi:formyltetrahydrofolate-dependent phosphoribosylglycinamide formyltransferase